MSSSRKLVIGLAGLLSVGVLLVGAGFWWVNQQISGVPGEGDPVTFEVVEGSSAASIGAALAEEGVIRNALAFRLVARSRGLDAQIRAGVYELETGMSVDEVIAALQEGPEDPEVLRITIPEGLTVEQTLQVLASDSPHDVGAYREVLAAARRNQQDGPLRIPKFVPSFDRFAADIEVFEGLLFPQTYTFELDATPAEILQRLLDQLEIAMASASPSAVAEAEAAGLTRYEALIIASLVERETPVPEEWDEVASVIRNRIAEGMRLQIDATLLYAAGNPDGGPEAVDTEVVSPYNTYTNAGLPPTPIAGARADVIQAVFEPADTEYLYYVVSPACDGTHQFATTLQEHNNNVAEFRSAGGCG